MRMTKTIEFQYFDGCPNSDATLENLKAIIESNLIENCILKTVEVPDAESAEHLNFQGSPTILYNGVDIYLLEVPDSFSYSCRLYSIDGKQTGILSKEYILAQIDKIENQVA